jgi:hypothetical protein
VAAALALAAKHSAGVVVAGVWTSAALVPWLGESTPARREDGVRTLAALLGAGLASLALFTILAPVWWSPARTVLLMALAALAWSFTSPASPRRLRGLRLAAVAAGLLALALDPAMPGATVTQASALVTERGALMREQVERFAPTAPRVGTLLREAFVPEPHYFEDPVWAGFPEIAEQIEAYRATGFTGRAGMLRWPSGVVLAALAGLGVASRLRRAREPGSVLLLAWLAVPALVLLASPLPWPRYYLMLQAPVAVLAGCGAASLAARVRGPS